jgi:hypothetical protein
VEPPVEDPKIVKTAPTVPFRTAEKDDVIAERPADLAWAALPFLGLQRLSVDQAPVGTGIIELFVLVEHIKEVL